MKPFALPVAFLLALSAYGASPGKLPQPSPISFTRQQAKDYFEMRKLLYPAKGDGYQKLIELFGRKDTYNGDQITAVTDPKTKAKRPPEKVVGRTGNPPIDTLSSDETRDWLRLQQQRSEKKEDFWEELKTRTGQQPWYTADEIRDVLEYGAEKPKEVAINRLATDPVGMEIAKAQSREKSFWEGFLSPRIRHDWRDVLYEEDKSQPDNAPRSIGSLRGANIAFTHNGVSNADTWSVVGALIVPWRHRWLPSDHWHLDEVTVAPSVSMNRISSNGDPKGEVDSLLYRVGTYLSWEGVLGRIEKDVSVNTSESARLVEERWTPPYIPIGLQVRAAGVYATDTGHEESLPGYEVDIEPRIKLPLFPLGYRQVLIRKYPLKEDHSDNSLLDFQVRAYFHLEGGNAQHVDADWIARTEDFFRVGPVVGFDLHAPRLFLHQSATLSMRYLYLSAIQGDLDRQYLFDAQLTYNILDDPFTGHKVGLTAEYQKGILPFTAEKIDTFTVGLSVLF